MAGRGAGGQAGYALAVVVGLITLLMVVGVGLSQVARLQLKAAQRQEERARAYYLARAAVARAQFELTRLWAQGDPYRARADGAWRRWESSEGTVLYSMQDEGGKLNLNQATAPVLERLLASIGLAGRRLAVVRDSLLDWVDEDGLARQAGAEDGWYRRSRRYLPRNGPLTSPAELALVRGVDGALAFGTGWGDPASAQPAGEGLWQVLTVYRRNRKVDLNSAPLKVLLALPGLNPSRAAKLVEARRRYPFRGFQRVARILGARSFRDLAPWLTVAPGRLYTVVARAKLAGGRARHELMAVVEVRPRGHPGVRFWLDDVVQSGGEAKGG
jgi:type II secretory pathway component PulK